MVGFCKKLSKLGNDYGWWSEIESQLKLGLKK